jgi:phosphodiesterase/alkaline phosphatase D-like protein
VNHDAISIIHESGKIRLLILNSAGTAVEIQSNDNIAINTWHHLVCKIDEQKNLKMYLDGRKQTQSLVWSGSYSGQTVTNIGNHVNDDDNFNGLLDDIRIYNRALSESEIMSIIDSEGGNLLTTWTDSTLVTLSHSTPSTDFQIPLKFNNSNFNYSKANPDGSDIRFEDNNGKKLFYWIEKWNDSGSSIVWVKAEDKGTSQIKMKYGNRFAMSESNGDSTFLFFDDFNDGIFNNKWFKSILNGHTGATITESVGLMTFTNSCMNSGICPEGPALLFSNDSIFIGSNEAFTIDATLSIASDLAGKSAFMVALTKGSMKKNPITYSDYKRAFGFQSNPYDVDDVSRVYPVEVFKDNLDPLTFTLGSLYRHVLTYNGGTGSNLKMYDNTGALVVNQDNYCSYSNSAYLNVFLEVHSPGSTIDQIKIYKNSPVEITAMLHTGLVAYYTFNGNTNDESGNGNNGTNIGSTLTTDRFGASSKAYSFNGTTNYITVANNSIFNFGTGDFTISAFIKTNIIPVTAWSAILSKHNTATSHDTEYFLMIEGSTGKPYFGLSTNTGVFERIYGPENICDNKFHLITGVKSNGQIKLYIDGQLVANASSLINPDNSNPINIGRSSYSNGYGYFNGIIDDVRIYNRALDPSEVDAIYHENSWDIPPIITNFNPTSGLIGTTVTITGYNFNPVPANNIVWFGAVKGSATAASATQLTVSVPAGASYQPISVTNITSGLTAYSEKPFNVTFASSQIIDASSFATKVDFPTGANQYHMLLCDMDCDGKSDLVVAATTTNKISIFRNISSSGSISTGSFAPRIDFPSGQTPYGLAAGDIDGDGKPDLLITNFDGGTFSIFRNISSPGTITTGSLASRVDFTTAANPAGIEIADIDSDGKPDILVSSFGSGVLSVYKNISTVGSISTGSLQTKVDFTTGSHPYGIVVCDIDKDGKPDVTVTNNWANTFSVFRNISTTGSITTGSLEAKVDFSTPVNPHFINAEDLDSDGKPDIVVSSEGSNILSIYKNTATSGTITSGSFASRFDMISGQYTSGIEIADINGDNKPDLVASNVNSHNVSVFRNIGQPGTLSSSSFIKTDFATSNSPYGVAIGDLDGDGLPDICTSNWTGSNISVLRNKISSAPTTVTSFAPATGPIGATVTITGNNFDPVPSNNIVRFGAVKAIVNSASATQLTVTVPIGASYQPISVTNITSGLTAYSEKPFNVTFPSSKVIDKASFSSPAASIPGTAPFFIAYADFDLDGKIDMVTSNPGSNTISVFKNTSTTGSLSAGSFQTKVDFSTGTLPYGVAVGDIDGDGKPDIAVTNHGSNSVSVFRNTTVPGSINTGSFAAKIDFSTGVWPHLLSIKDIDGDGKPDIAVANKNSLTVSILRNTSTQGIINSEAFSPKIDFSTGTEPYGVEVADIDADGRQDVIITNTKSNSVSVYRNIGAPGLMDSGSFSSRVDFTTGTDPMAVCLQDIDLDGKPDMVVTNRSDGTVSLFRNSSSPGVINSGSFEARVDLISGLATNLLSIGDIDGDGKADIIVTNTGGNSISVFRNLSTPGVLTSGSFSLKNDFDCNEPYGIAVFDIDNDGKMDIAAANQSINSLSLMRNLVNIQPVISSFTPSSGPIGTSVTITGTNFSSVPSENTVWFGAVKATVNAATSTQLTVTAPAGATYQPITVTVNGLTSYSAKPFNITFSSSQIIDATSMAPKVDLSGGGKPYHVAVGDIDGDGKPDIATVNLHTSNTVSIYRNIGNTGSLDAGSFAPRIDLATDTNPYGVIIGDIDGDGKKDLAVSIGNSGVVSVFRNIGSPGAITTGSFAEKVSFQTGSNPFGIDMGDIDGDGKPELVTANFAGNSFSVLRNTSIPGSITLNSFEPKVDFMAGALPYFITIDDFDMDGKPDIALTNYNDNSISVYRNTSIKGSINSNSFSDKVDFATGNLPISITSGDIDGDAKPDIAVTNNQTNNISIFRNTSTPGIIDIGTFSVRLDFATETAPTVTALSDFDGDGKVDLAVSNYGAGKISIYKNISSPGQINSGSFLPGTSYSSGNCFHIASGDLDCDGKPDLIGSNNDGNTIPVIRNLMVFLPPPSIPTALASGTVTQTGFSANWNSSTNATGYYLDVSTVNDFSSFVSGYNGKDVSNVITYNVTGLTAATTYYYRVRAYNGAGTSASSNQISVITLPEPPSAPVAGSATSLTQTSLYANWTAVSGASGYRLDVSANNTFSSFIAGYDNLDVSNVTTYYVSGLTAGTSYYYRVRAYNSGGASASSNSITTATLINVPPAPVSGAAGSVTNTGFTANWSASATATGYRIDISVSNTFSTFVAGYNDLNVNNVTSFAVTGLSSNTTYYYRVRAYNAGGNSANSNTISETTLIDPPQAPVALVATSGSQTGFTANWNSSATATGYRLDISTSNTFSTFLPGYNNLDVSNVQTYPVTGLTANTTYYYRVRAYNSTGPSVSSNVITAPTLPVPPSPPVADIASTYTQTSFAANWASSATATGYRLDVSTSITFSTFITGYNDLNVGNVTSYSVIGLTANTTYYYRVRAYNSGGTSLSSNVITAVTLMNPPPSPVATSPSSVTQTSMIVNWSAASTATGYRLDVSTTNTFSSFVTGYNNLDVSNVTSYSLSGLTQNTTYYYRVRAYNNGGNGDYSNIISQATLPDPPATVTPLPANPVYQTSFTANWQPAATATGYYLDVASDIGFVNMLAGYNHKDVGLVTSTVVTGLTQNSTYFYRIISYNTGGTGFGSVSVNVTTLPDPPPVPVALTANAISQTGFRANWNHSSTATGYKLDVATDNAFTNIVSGYSDKDVSYVNILNVTGLNPKTDYFYRVRAYNTGGTSSNSNTIALKTLPDPPAAPSGLSVKSCNDQVTLSWTGNTEPEILRYRIYGGQTANTVSLLDSTATGVTTKTFTGLQHGKVYYFRLKAVLSPNVAGNYSSEVNVKVKVGHIPKLILKWGEVLVCSNAADSIIKGKYQWYKDNSPLTTDFTNNQFLDTRGFPANFRSGVYKVKITDTDGCVNFSNSINVTGAKSLSLYPNPAKTDVSVSLKDEPLGITVISIINNAGITIREMKTSKEAEDLLEELDVSGLDEGIYFVKVVVDDQYEYYSKIVVIK